MTERNWWESLQHYGLLLGPAQVRELERQVALEPASPYELDRLRRELNRFDAGDIQAGDLATSVLETVCGLGYRGAGDWTRGSRVLADYRHLLITGEPLRPRHLWTPDRGDPLPVFFDDNPRLGMHRGRKRLSDCIQWLRAADLPLALLTNGREWRLLYAGLDFHAGCQWHVDRWFEGGEPGPQLEALRRLLSPEALTAPDKRQPSPLVAAIQESRRGQAELSAELGERVRQAVEELVRCHGPALDAADLDASGADIYRAAVRTVMRLVVIFFAESRGLLPQDDRLYADAYSLRGLFEQLDRQAGRLKHREAAWPRIVALFRLVHQGSHHEALQIPAYGGELFRPGDPKSSDPMRRTLYLFETACLEGEHELLVPDAAVHRILRLLSRSRLRIRQGRASTWTTVPVDFSDLSSEYIGILYEGLLDYELRQAGDDPVLFLAVGNQPALPLSRLESMADRQIKALFEKLKDTTSRDELEEAEEELEEEEADEEEADKEDATEEDEGEGDEPDEDEEDDLPDREAARGHAEAWAREAAQTAGLVKKPRGKKTPEKRQAYERRLDAKARAMTRRVVLPGEWYLVRWGGTRKGSGTFYTRPSIAVPLVQRTLRPLAFDPPEGDDGQPDLDAPHERWNPKKPEEILALKVCDPACGSGTFPVAALRFLTDALYRSLWHHDRIRPEGDGAFVHLLDTGDGPPEEALGAERLRCRPDDEHFEELLRAQLRRHVVERTIYGVDLDPLAVELCRLALWIETLDRELPFSFLRHKIKAGDSLVGCWFDRFQHYPALAWKREAGDASHTNGVHFEKGELTKAIKRFCGNVNIKDPKTVRLDLLHTLEERPLFSSERQDHAESTHNAAKTVIEGLHELPVHDTEDRARRYERDFLGSPAWKQLETAFDLWCACWFWPADELDAAPLPSEFASPREATRERARQIAGERRFFHWELEFPDVFDEDGAGFDAVIGNPPWEIAKPSSKEFFSNIDPLYRSYGKQAALRRQTEYFETKAEIEHDWLDYSADFKARSNWVRNGAFPWGDPEDEDDGGNRLSLARGKQNQELHQKWRDLRRRAAGYADPEHPFRHQGSADINLYKLFLEQGHNLLQRGGRLGLLVPSGLYSDYGTQTLRELFLDRCRWEWIFGFENREGIFDIHRSFKFNPVIIAKGGRTDAIRTAFMRRRVEDWEDAEEHVTPYSRSQVVRFSPNSRAVLEIQSQRDLEILDTIYSNSVLLGDKGPDGWGIEYATEFHMTNDSKLFPPRPEWEKKGYRPDEYSRWLKGDWQPRTRMCPAPPGCKRVEIPEGVILSRDGEGWIREEAVTDTALPLYQGVMIGPFDFSRAAWMSGTGLKARWRRLDWQTEALLPQFLVAESTWKSNGKSSTLRCGFRDIARSTDQRTMIAALLPAMPCGNKVPTLRTRTQIDLCRLLLYLNSWCFDWQERTRQGSTSINYYILSEGPLPPHPAARQAEVVTTVRLGATSQTFAPTWLRMRKSSSSVPWRTSWALTRAERLRTRCVADALAALAFGISSEQLAWILRGCDRPAGQTGDEPKGFWRVDKGRPPELRHTVLSQIAFHNLEAHIRDHGVDRTAAIASWLAQNDGEGWMLPEQLRLSDYGLGHDNRADRPQPVASRLGPRLYDWQLEQDPVESWKECELHARNLLGEAGFRELIAEIEGERAEPTWQPYAEVAEPAAGYDDTLGQRGLFSDE